MHRLCGSVACGIFLDQGSNLHLHWQTDSLPLSHQGSPHFAFYILGVDREEACRGSRWREVPNKIADEQFWGVGTSGTQDLRQGAGGQPGQREPTSLCPPAQGLLPLDEEASLALSAAWPWQWAQCLGFAGSLGVDVFLCDLTQQLGVDGIKSLAS